MILWIALACAVKDGSEVLRIQQVYQEHVKKSPSKELGFEESMAKLYMQKSWEEYTNAQYQDALVLAVKSEEWLKKSIEREKGESKPSENVDKESESPQKDGDKTELEATSEPNKATEIKEKDGSK